MKKMVVSALVLFTIPVFAAKMKDAKCSDVASLKDNVTPEYLAVIDGYDKSGKKVMEEVDMGGLVTESKMVNEQCAKDSSAKLANIRKDIKSNQPITSTSSTLNPMKAKCKDFVALGEDVQPVAVFWVAGHDKSGKVKSGEIDEEFLERPVTTLVEDCKMNPKASFYDKAKAWFKKTL